MEQNYSKSTYPTHKYDANPPIVLWEFDGDFGPEFYLESISVTIEKSYQARNQYLTIQKNGKSYDINFMKNLEIDKENGKERMICRIFLDPKILLIGTGLSLWEYKDDSGNYKEYTIDIAQTLETNYRSKMMKFNIDIKRTTYAIDLVNMDQINIKTGHKRKMKRKDKVVSNPISMIWLWCNDNNVYPRHTGAIFILSLSPEIQ